MSPVKREKIIKNGSKIIGFLPVSNSDLEKDHEEIVDNTVDQGYDCQLLKLDDEVCLILTGEIRVQNLISLQYSLKFSLQSLEWVTIPGFLSASHSNGVYICLPKVLSYYAEIPEARILRTVKHGLFVSEPCHMCLLTLEDFDKMTHCNIHNIFRMVIICVKVQ